MLLLWGGSAGTYISVSLMSLSRRRAWAKSRRWTNDCTLAYKGQAASVLFCDPWRIDLIAHVIAVHEHIRRSRQADEAVAFVDHHFANGSDEHDSIPKKDCPRRRQPRINGRGGGCQQWTNLRSSIRQSCQRRTPCRRCGPPSRSEKSNELRSDPSQTLRGSCH